MLYPIFMFCSKCIKLLLLSINKNICFYCFREIHFNDMATRSLTDIFLLMRTNSIQSRGIYSFQGSKRREYETDSDEDVSDKVALMEAGRSMEMRSHEKSPPTWAGLLEDAQYSITRF